jgi:hypothetical protein
MIDPKKITVIETYWQDQELEDGTLIESEGDYVEVYVLHKGVIAARWGDYYHDKGCVRAEAWVQGFKFFNRCILEVEHGSIEVPYGDENLDYKTIKKLYKPD